MSKATSIKLVAISSFASAVSGLLKFANIPMQDTPLSATHRGPYNVSLPDSEVELLFMDWMPAHGVVLCSCAKCASTSLYEWIYEQHFGKPWTYGKTWPYAQELNSERWHGAFEHVNDSTMQDAIFEKSYSFALIRDPKERLLSAWKSKVACDAEKYGTDVHDRQYFTYSETFAPWPRGFVPQLQKLYGAEENRTCLELNEFVDALMEIKMLGRTSLLDRHFLPQDQVCFQKFPAKQWSEVTTVTDQAAFDRLSKHLGAERLVMKGIHHSTGKVTVHPEVNAKLDILTREEYEMFGPYLSTSGSSAVQAGSVALNEVRFAQ